MQLLRLATLIAAAAQYRIAFSQPKATRDSSEGDDHWYDGTSPWKTENWALLMLKLSKMFSWTASGLYAFISIYPGSPATSQLAQLVSILKAHFDLMKTPPMYIITGFALVTIGCMIRTACFREMGRLFTFKHTIRKDHKLITSGPYAYVRHPSYVGAILVSTGMVLCFYCDGRWLSRQSDFGPAQDAGESMMPVAKALVQPIVGILTWGMRIFAGWAVVSSLMFIPRTLREDDGLRQHFGREWEEYARRVPYSLMPGVF